MLIHILAFFLNHVRFLISREENHMYVTHYNYYLLCNTYIHTYIHVRACTCVCVCVRVLIVPSTKYVECKKIKLLLDKRY